MSYIKKISLVMSVIMLTFILVPVTSYASSENEGSISGEMEFYLTDDVVKSLEEDIAPETKRLMEYQGTFIDNLEDITEQIGEEYYGGAYFDNSGQLHIVVTDTQKVQEQKSQRMLKAAGIEYEIGKYSYIDLENMIDILDPYLEMLNIDVIGIDQEFNKLMIYGQIDSKTLSSYIPSDAFEIIQGYYPARKLSGIFVLSLGLELYNYNTTKSATLGCVVEKGGKKYGLTAGHFLRENHRIQAFFGATIGYGTERQVAGNFDAGLFEPTDGSDYRCSNVVGGNVVTRNGGTWPKNTIIIKSGITTGITTGAITEVGASYYANGYKMTDMVRTNALADNGDSGGPVITYDGTNRTYCLIGIVESDIGTGMNFSKMQNIKDAWSLNMW